MHQCFHSVVVITSALHAEGRRFEPGWKLFYLLRLRPVANLITILRS